MLNTLSYRQQCLSEEWKLCEQFNHTFDVMQLMKFNFQAFGEETEVK